jgi:hypothetical protein
METGRPRVRVTIEERTAKVLELTEKPWRRWNPHMRGVGLALRLAFGVPLGDDEEGLWLTTPKGRIHMLEAYAMANLLLCSAVKGGGKKGRATSTMRRNCLRHLDATISILQPTLVISQGKTVGPPVRGLVNVQEEHSPTLATCSLNGRRFVWADLYHPTFHWDWLAKPYLRQVVEPTLTEARKRALGLVA